jgi:hypothetical protein
MIYLKYVYIAAGIHFVVDFYSLYRLYFYIKQLKNANASYIQCLQNSLKTTTMEYNKLKLEYDLLKNKNKDNDILLKNEPNKQDISEIVNDIVNDIINDIVNDIVNEINNEKANEINNEKANEICDDNTYIKNRLLEVQPLFEYDHIDKCYLVGNNVPSDIRVKHIGFKNIVSNSKNVSISCINWFSKWIN